MQTSLTLSLPDWIPDYLEENNKQFGTLEDKMEFVLGLANSNILKKTGGPFSAAIFNADTNELVSCGVNRVVPESSSAAHAEMMAIMLAQKSLNTFDFSLKGNFQMVTSSKMCIMCLGNVIWSGLKEVAFSADTADVQSITGFDEGPVPKQYTHELQIRGINVIERVLQQKGRNILQLYVNNGGYVYNSSANKVAQEKQAK